MKPNPTSARAFTAWEPGCATQLVDPTLRSRLLKALSKHCSQNAIDVRDLMKKIGGDPAAVRRELDALIAGHQVITASVFDEGVSREVVYPVGRVPTHRPGRRVGAIDIPPSNHAKSVHGGTLA
ncbi:MAG: hypothetical protein JSR83_09080 [Proteobacteria bacterium]|nr:hypothetical protein [Pseudomonadota bacterium]